MQFIIHLLQKSASVMYHFQNIASCRKKSNYEHKSNLSTLVVITRKIYKTISSFNYGCWAINF